MQTKSEKGQVTPKVQAAEKDECPRKDTLTGHLSSEQKIKGAW